MMINKEYSLAMISKLIHFNLDHKEWIYTQAGQRSLEATQVEGVYGLMQRLKQHDVALLADEVGMGKTIQALSVMSLLWLNKANAKILVLAPNMVICDQWRNEFENLRHRHANADLAAAIKHIRPILCKNFIDSDRGVLKQIHHIQSNLEQQPLFCLTTIHSLSGLVPEDKKDNSITVAQDKAREINNAIKSVLSDGFDLVVVDEAHYFRNVHGGSQRVAAAKGLFGEPTGATRLAKQYLLLTATPSHSNINDVNNILGFFKDTHTQSPNESLKRYAVRRLRFMQGRDGAYNKYHYRNEHVLEADFKEDPSSELFFALYQKELVGEYGGKGDGKSFLYGYLEGFESIDKNDDDNTQDTKDTVNADSFHTAVDTGILDELCKEFKQAPAHPKYSVIQNACVPKALFNQNHDIKDDKSLIFVRRIPSVREITQRINADYDEIFAMQIVEALAPLNKIKLLKQWKNEKWSREFFDKKISIKNNREGNFYEKSENDTSDEENPRKSHILDLFIIKKNDKVKTTDCSNFRNRLVIPNSLFSILLEPSSDYKTGEYLSFYTFEDAQKKAEYLSAIRDYRNKKVLSKNVANFEIPLKTLWADLYTQLEKEQEKLFEIYNGWSDASKENFSQYFKIGILYASPVIVELYCWFSKFLSTGQYNGNDVQISYRNFISWINNKKLLPNSLLYKYFSAAMTTFEALCTKIVGLSFEEQVQPDTWKDLKQLHNPAWYASGEVQNRRRLIIGFNSPFFPNVLSATHIFQEGVNLHLQCNKIFNYGMAWTPGANEQRIGRIDRLFGKVHRDLIQKGQESKLDIYYPYLKNTFDQEQLASFVIKKQTFEDQLDRGVHSNFDKSIHLSSTTDWMTYLHKPKPFDESVNEDPYPAL